MYKLTDVALTMMGYQFFDDEGNPCELSSALDINGRLQPREGVSLQTALGLDPMKEYANDTQLGLSKNSDQADTGSKEDIQKDKVEASRTNHGEGLSPKKASQQEPLEQAEGVGIAVKANEPEMQSLGRAKEAAPSTTTQGHLDKQDFAEKYFQPIGGAQEVVKPQSIRRAKIKANRRIFPEAQEIVQEMVEEPPVSAQKSNGVDALALD